MARIPKQHQLFLPSVVPLLLIFCLASIPFFWRPAPVSAQDRAVVTRVREYFPADELLPDTEIYYPQLSFGGNPNQLQTANAMMREYAIRQYHLYRQAAKSGTLPAAQDWTGAPAAVLADYQVQRNSGGYFSVQFENLTASLANHGSDCFTVRLSDQKVCRLADLFLSSADYCSLLDQEISRQLQRSFKQVRFDTDFYLSDRELVLLLPREGTAEREIFKISLSQPAVARKLAPWLTIGHTETAPISPSGAIPSQEPPEESSPPMDE